MAEPSGVLADKEKLLWKVIKKPGAQSEEGFKYLMSKSDKATLDGRPDFHAVLRMPPLRDLHDEYFQSIVLANMVKGGDPDEKLSAIYDGLSLFGPAQEAALTEKIRGLEQACMNSGGAAIGLIKKRSSVLGSIVKEMMAEVVCFKI